VAPGRRHRPGLDARRPGGAVCVARRGRRRRRRASGRCR
jgi:hypothetical protein